MHMVKEMVGMLHHTSLGQLPVPEQSRLCASDEHCHLLPSGKKYVRPSLSQPPVPEQPRWSRVEEQ